MKATICASSRKDDRMHLEFVKDQAFVEIVLKLVDMLKMDWGVFKDHNYDTDETRIEKIDDIEDELMHFQDDRLRIDIFVGHKKAIFVMEASQELQQQALDEIDKHSEWKKWNLQDHTRRQAA